MEGGENSLGSVSPHLFRNHKGEKYQKNKPLFVMVSLVSDASFSVGGVSSSSSYSLPE